MRDGDGTPDHRARTARDHLAAAASTWIAGAWGTLRPVIRKLAELYADPPYQATVSRREALTGQLRSNCHCLCALAHPGQRVCDHQAVTVITRYSDTTGRVDVSVCAPCAAEDVAATLQAL